MEAENTKPKNEILQLEIESKNYKVENLPKHITRFVKVQYKPTTKNTYQNGLTKFYNYLTNTETNTITQANINWIIKEYKSNLENHNNLASTTIDNYTEIVKVFCNSYLDLQVKKIKRNNTRKTQKIKYLELEEIKGLVNTVQYTTRNQEIITRDKAIICTLFGAGLRISELLNTQLVNYNPDESTIIIIGKGRAIDEEETIVLPKQTNELIQQYLQQRRANNRGCKYLFCSNTDKQLSRQAVNKNIKKYAKAYDTRNNKNITPKVSTHSFRHSLSRFLLVNKGIPINKVKDILRHSNIETTAKYLENSQEEIQELRKSIVF